MPNKLKDGFLIVFDGIDGVGKTTQLNLAKDSLAAAGWPVIVRRNLGGTPIGEELRQVIKGDMPRPAMTNLYISAAIQAALVDQVDVDRQSGQLILMDRGPLSLAAYEVYGSGLDKELTWPHVKYGMDKLRPDLMVIFEADTAASLSRARRESADPDYFESQPNDYFDRVAEGYKQLASEFDCLVLNGERPIETIHDELMEIIEASLAKLS